MDRKVFKCRVENCPKTFKDPTGRRKHEGGPMHAKGPDHKCACGKEYFSRASLRRHQKEAHSDVSHVCEKCG